VPQVFLSALRERVFEKTTVSYGLNVYSEHSISGEARIARRFKEFVKLISRTALDEKERRPSIL